jgi:NitT/TauT family transport system permease protein
MSVAHEVHTGTLAAAGAQPAPAVAKAQWWERPALFRYGFVALILIVWEIAGPFVSPIFFTYPSKIAVAFYTLTVSGELPYFLGQSLEVMVYGLGIAIAVGIPLAVAMARVRWLDWALDLPINALYATPLVAVVPLLVLWFGIYLKAKIIVVFLFAVFPVLINTYQGVRECDKNMIEVARSFRSNEWRMWQDVLLPFAVPYIIAGIRLAIGRGLIGMIIAEFYTTITGLGFMITRYANMFEMDKTFVPVIVLMILGVSLTTMLKWAGRRIAPWSHGNR